ncbi:MAG: hypothetical protein HQ517_14265 [SAR324 cluster bacterium]|nr:hypothetical protein [SAR324 cluster bacterium]
MGVDKQQIDKIVNLVVSRLQQEGVDFAKAAPASSQPETVTNGLFQQTDQAVQAAAIAQKQLRALPLAVREEIIQAIREVGWPLRTGMHEWNLQKPALVKKRIMLKKCWLPVRSWGWRI